MSGAQQFTAAAAAVASRLRDSIHRTFRQISRRQIMPGQLCVRERGPMQFDSIVDIAAAEITAAAELRQMFAD